MINKMIEKWKNLKRWQKILIVLLAILILVPATNDESTDNGKEENKTVEKVGGEDNKIENDKETISTTKEKDEEKEEIIDDRPKTIILEINDAIEKNEMKASETYRDKKYLITAEIEEISTTLIKGNPKLKMRQGNVIFDVTFSNGNIAFYNMEKGDTITFIASYSGFGIEGDFVKAKLTEETVNRFK